MLLRYKKNNLLVVVVFSCLGIFMLKKPMQSNLLHRLTANIITNEGVELRYIINVLEEDKFFLKTTFNVGDEKYVYTRLFEFVKIEGNVFIINEVSVHDVPVEIIEYLDFDFFSTVQELEIYGFSAHSLVAYSNDRFLFFDEK